MAFDFFLVQVDRAAAGVAVLFGTAAPENSQSRRYFILKFIKDYTFRSRSVRKYSMEFLMRKIYVAILAIISVLLISNPSSAQSLAAPKGDPVLVISGQISNTNVGGTAQFDLPMLEALGMVKISTKTPWYDGVVTFEGVSMDQLMKLVGARGQTVRAIALNDYVTTIPLDDFAKFGTIMAIKQNGQYMPVRDKGPLFIIYPFDSNAELQTQTYYGRSAWQLAKLVVE